MHVTSNGANDLSSINSLIDNSLKELVMEDTLDVFADDAVSLLTSATERSIAHTKKFNEAFAQLKEEHQAEMEAHQPEGTAGGARSTGSSAAGCFIESYARLPTADVGFAGTTTTLSQ
jgi:hypothetical protein